MLALIQRVIAGSQSFSGMDIAALDGYLDVSGKKRGLARMARAQYLTLWLNLASDKLGFTTVVDISSVPGWDSVVSDADGVMTVNELLLQLRERYNVGAMSEDRLEAFKDICDAINNYMVFTQPPTGPID